MRISLAGLASMLAAVAAASLPAPALAERAMQVATLPDPGDSFYWAGADYDPAIPDMRRVLGYAPGTRVAGHGDVVRYFEALAAAAPDRVRLIDYGRSWQGRRLFYAVIGSPQMIASLDQIEADGRRLADPRGLAPGEAEALIRRHPAVVWLAHSVHGDEISPTESAMLTAYHLLAARGDARMAAVRANALVIINPLQNPDGRERFIASSVSATGAEASASPLAAERDQQWPGGRVNHMAFDLNRDWFALTQPETRAHTAAILRWHPHVLADIHEMGTEATYFFPPEAEPINPNVTASQLELRQIIGRTNAAWFDRLGIPYFTRERFDLFYPGYGDGWPTMQGAIAMTYEQGSARGLVATRPNGETLTFPDTIRNQFVASLATLEAAANNRERFVRGYFDFRRTAVEEGRRGPTRAWVIPAQTDQSTADKLAALLVRQGVEVARASSGFSACGRSFGAGSYVISTAQPTGRLIRNLLEPNTAMDPAFVQRQLDRRLRGLDDEIYDVTAWSLPLIFNVDAVACATEPAVPGATAAGPQLQPPGQVINAEAKVAFVAPGGSAATGRFTVAALRAGLRVRSMSEAFELDGTDYPEGSVVVTAADNAGDLAQRVGALAVSSGATVTGHGSSWVTEGPSLGSSRAVELRLPRIAIAWDRPVGRNSAGNTRYVLEQKLGFAVTPVRVERMASADLAGFDVVILPDSEGSYGRAVGASGTANLRRFVERGGVLVSFAGATAFLAAPDVNLIAARPDTAAPEGDAAGPAPAEGGAAPGTRVADLDAYRRLVAGAPGQPTGLSGAFLRLETDPEQWLTTGLKPEMVAMVGGNSIYRPLTRAQGENPVRFAAPDRVVASGVVWEPTRQQIAFKPFVMLQRQGAGLVVAFTADPSYRGQADGLDPLILNAMLQTTARVQIIR